MIETVEQLGWLASALRPSPLDQSVSACSPSLTSIQISNGKEEESSEYALQVSGRIDFHFVTPPALETPGVGFCWSNLFRNPVLVAGYPIPQRRKPDSGLEMSIYMISLLINSAEVFKVKDNIVLKGFCSMLIAMEATKDLVIWHHVFNSSGERISFFDPRIETLAREITAGILLRDLESQQHIVGWCGNVKECSSKQTAIKAGNRGRK